MAGIKAADWWKSSRRNVAMAEAKSPLVVTWSRLDRTVAVSTLNRSKSRTLQRSSDQRVE